MKQIAVAVVATTMLLISDKQQVKLTDYTNKKAGDTVTKNNQGIMSNTGNSLQEDCFDTGDFLNEILFTHF